MKIERSIMINAPAESVFKKLNNFNEWTPWSPWLCMEPEAKVNVAPDTKYYEWDGNRVGSGNMKVLEEKENEYIDYDLNFIKPWKSHAKTSFKLENTGEGTRVTWDMDSKLPFFMFWMRKMMEAYVGADYERGLDMLKAYVENGEIHSNMEFNGTSNYEGCKFVGIKRTASLNDIGQVMAADFGKLGAYGAEQDCEVTGNPFSIYHKWDMVKQQVIYTAGLPCTKTPASLPSGMISGEIPSTKTYSIRHTGAYEHLGNAWGTLYAMQRNKEFKLNKRIKPFEIYRNSPQDTPSKDLVTDLYIPVK